MSDPEMTPMLFVVEGLDTDAQGKPFVVLHALNRDGSLGPELNYNKKRSNQHLRTGQVYEIKARDGGATINFASARWVEEYQDKDKVLAWQAATQAAEVRAGARAREKKEATNQSALDREIEALGRAYQQLRPQDRPAFELWLLYRIRGRRTS